MRMDDARESENVEDRRGMGGRGFRPGGVGGLGIGGVILLLVISYFLGVDPSQLLNDSGVSTGGGPPASTPAGPPGSDPAGEFAEEDSRGYRGHVDRDFRAFGTAVLEARARAVLRRSGLSMWPGGVGHRSVLLSGRSEGLSRSQFLPGARPAVRCSWRLRAGLRHRARDRPSRPEPDGQPGERRRAVASAVPTRSRCARNSRRIVWRACGGMRRRGAIASSRATPRKGSGRLPPSATIACNRRVRAGSSRTRSHTARRRIAWRR